MKSGVGLRLFALKDRLRYQCYSFFFYSKTSGTLVGIYLFVC